MSLVPVTLTLKNYYQIVFIHSFEKYLSRTCDIQYPVPGMKQKKQKTVYSQNCLRKFDYNLLKLNYNCNILKQMDRKCSPLIPIADMSYQSY